MKLVSSIILVLVSFVFVASSSAEIIPLSATMNGENANAGSGTGSSGTGFATITYNTVTSILNWEITWSGLSGTPTVMHFHGPATENQNAGVQVSTGVSGPPVIGSSVLTPTQKDDMFEGLWYLNLHTDAFPGGEIRGQVLRDIVPNSKTSWTAVKATFK